MFVVTGATGNTGSVVASSLLERGRPVRVVVRTGAGGAPWAARGAEVAIASLDDSAAFARTLEGAQGLYYLVPQDLSAPDLYGWYRRYITALLDALGRTRTPVPHVVYLSSWGAHAPDGPIRMHHEAEGALRRLASKFTFVRPAYFMENALAMLPSMKERGVFPSFIAPDAKISMVTTRDIGHVAADALCDPPAATRVVELAGPEDYSMRDIALAFARALGRPVDAVHVPPAALATTLTSRGYSDGAVAFYRAMVAAFESGALAFEGGTRDIVRGTTTINAFADAACAALRRSSRPAEPAAARE